MRELKYDELMKTVIYVPCDATKIKVKASWRDADGKKRRARMVLDREKIDKAREAYLDLDEDDDADAVYKLTDNGRRWINEFYQKTIKTEEDDTNSMDFFGV